jgi:DNA-binding CsgD family transcriptional regulator
MPKLTRRERDVAELLAQGLTNREIAERLFIGVRTAEYHVDQLRNKLGVRSRAQVAVMWMEQKAAVDTSGGVRSEVVLETGQNGAEQEKVGRVGRTLSALERRQHRVASTGRPRWLHAVAAISLAGLALGGGLFTWPRIHLGQPAVYIQTFAGIGVASFSGDGGPATRAALREPNGIAVGPMGAVFVATDGRIRRISADGAITTVAGNGNLGSSGDGGAAALAEIGVAGKWGNTGLAVDNAGSVYIPDAVAHSVRRISPAGIITTIAGTGTPGESGDGGPANAATLTSPRGVAVDDRGAIFIAEAGGHRVRRIDPSGVISRYAGTGEVGSGGDGGPAAAAQLNAPEAVVLDRAGNLFIADTANNRIRRVALDGSISTVAGDGRYGFSGDGGPATKAQLALPRGLASGSHGVIHIADSDNHRVRLLDAAGTINTIAGTGTAGYSGDGDSPPRAQLNEPDGVAVDDHGRLYIADAGNHRIRIVN